MYKRCFALLEVTVSVQAQGYDGDVRVFYHDSVVRLFEAGIFDLHPSAKSAVEKYLSNFKSPQTRKGMALEIALEACRFLEKAQEPVRAESLARVLGSKKGTASKLLIKLVKCGRIKLVEKPWKSERIYELAE